MYPRFLSKVFTCAKAHGYCGIELVERGEHIWVFIRCWDINQFRRVCVPILDRFSSNVNEEVVVLGCIIDAIEPVLDAEDDSEDSFVEVVGGKKRFEGAEPEGSLSLMLSCV